MPLISVRTSLPAVENGAALLQDLSAALARQTRKPEAYVMTLLEAGVPMTFAGSSEPCTYVEIKSISARTDIPADRFYLAFEDVKAASWGWNGRTFG